MVAIADKRQVYSLFAIIVLAAALGSLSQTGLNAMLVTVCSDFGISEGVGQALTTAYMLALGITVPASSFLLGRFRMKDLVLLAISIFVAGSLTAALAPNFIVLFVGRVVQAGATGMLLPLVQTVAMTRFPEGHRATAMGVSGIALGFSPNIGPTIGGAMVDTFGWRSFFWLLVALSLTLVIVGFIIIERRDDAAFPARFDMLSFILCALGFSGVLLGCSEASSFSLSHPLVWAPIIVGALLLVAFIIRQKRAEDPFIDLGIFSSTRYVVGFTALCLMYASFMGITLLVPLFIEDFRGGSAMEAGMVLLPGTVAALILNPLGGFLADRIGTRPVCVTAGVFLATGATLMALFCDASTPLWLVCAMQGVRTVGVSSLIGPLTSWSLSELSGKRVSDGSAFGLAARQACASVGTAALVFCVEGGLLSGAASFHAAFGVSAVFAIATCVVMAARVR